MATPSSSASGNKREQLDLGKFNSVWHWGHNLFKNLHRKLTWKIGTFCNAADEGDNVAEIIAHKWFGKQLQRK